MAPTDERWAEVVFIKHPGVIAMVFLVVYAIALAFLLANLSAHHPLGTNVSDAISALLALGTLTLAYAAIVSALLTARTRRMQVAPRLDFEFSHFEISNRTGIGDWVPLVADRFDLPLPFPPGEGFRVVLRNIGSGAAVGIRVWGRYGSNKPAPDPNAIPGQLTGPVTSNVVEYLPFTDSLSIPAGEERAFPIHLYSIAPGLQPAGGPHFLVVSQIVLSAEGADVEGRSVRAPPIGIFHADTIQTGPATAPFTVATWGLLTEKIAERLAGPIPSGVKGTFASQLLPKDFFGEGAQPPGRP